MWLVESIRFHPDQFEFYLTGSGYRCTRWFLPLLLLPLPIASPYFLLLFLLSLILHARPCFYCIVLLTALFTSSCYWQPVPTSALLEATFPNVSASFQLFYLPNASLTDEKHIPTSQLLPAPKLTTLLDRCWCELSGGHIFDPYNATLWQLTSLSRAMGASKLQRVIVVQKQLETSLVLANSTHPVSTPPLIWVLRATGQSEDEHPSDRSSDFATRRWLHPSQFVPTLKSFLNFTLHMHIFRSSTPQSQPRDLPLAVPPPRVSRNQTAWSSLFADTTYDLRQHGINLVIDFCWKRKGC
ncbi:hypothetical protein BU17DRAFT_56837 [Hysterangium stoloniferum]|nr:hypothetical protein BU17DRAFT_56837 [Hysterangium stoloniferum]